MLPVQSDSLAFSTLSRVIYSRTQLIFGHNFHSLSFWHCGLYLSYKKKKEIWEKPSLILTMCSTCSIDRMDWPWMLIVYLFIYLAISWSSNVSINSAFHPFIHTIDAFNHAHFQMKTKFHLLCFFIALTVFVKALRDAELILLYWFSPFN